MASTAIVAQAGRRRFWWRLLTLLALVAAVVMIAVIADRSYRAYRLDQYGITADAEILDSDLGCIFASGGAGPMSGTITYRVRFPTDDGPHTTDVVRPCDVIPPDFGRGRGAIWVEYDAQHPDRVRVLTDQSDRDAAMVLSLVLVIDLVGVSIAWLLRRFLPPPKV